MGEIHFDLHGVIPSKKNSRITQRSTGRSFPSAKYTAWHRESMKYLPRVKASDNPLHIRIDFRLDSLRARDLSNMTESVMDLMVDAEIISDDNWKVVPRLTLSGKLDRNDPGATVTIYQD